MSAPLLRLTFVALGFAFALAPAAAAHAPPRYCRSVAAKLKADSDLAAAARAAFGAPQATDDEACLYPLQLLRYADVDVLVSQTGEPGEACHGCEASLSATVLKRVPGGAKRLRAFPVVRQRRKLRRRRLDPRRSPSAATTRSRSSWAARSKAIRLRRSTSTPSADRVSSISAAGAPLLIEGDNSGAETDASKTIEVDSAWSLAGGELTIDYHATDARGKRDSRAVWSVGDTTLTLKSGAPPKELARATGQE